MEEQINSHNQLIANIFKTFKYIDKKEWNKAKSVWIFDVCKMNPDKDMHFDCYGSEYMVFGHYVRCLQELIYYCEN